MPNIRLIHKSTAIIALILLVILAMIAIDDRISTPIYHWQNSKQATQKPVQIAIITDLHSSTYGQNQHEILDILYAKKPDAILLGGDIYDDELPELNTDLVLSKLTQITPNVYYVNGNHELYLPTQEYHRLEQKIRSYQIAIIHGIGADLPIDGKPTDIKIWGVHDPVQADKFWQQLHTIGKQLDPQHINILLSHRPEHIDDYLKYPFDIIVSGHAHGGQWRVPYLINGVFAPNQGILPKYAGGEYWLENPHTRSKRSQFIVSRGLAKESTRYIPRIFNRPELVFLTIAP